MTHEEMLAKLEQFKIFDDAEPLHALLVKVVELTRPMETYGTATITGYNEAMSLIFKAIEKELN